MTETLAELRPSTMRRGFGVATLFGLGALLLYLGLAGSYADSVWQIFLILMALGALFAGWRMQQATAMHLTLTDAGLYDSSGFELAAMEDIVSVDRGMMAFKPSNGFMVKLKARKARRWRPGLYWISGRRIGVGGVTSASEGKAMADILAMKLAEAEAGQG